MRFVLVVFLLLALAYSIAIPIFETPDELQHYAVVNYIARYRWFPPLGDKPAEHLWDQQALQAPLFYWLAAAATFWVDPSDFSQQAILQPKANIGDATLPGKKNAFLHGPDQSFPYQGVTLAVHLCRWLSALFGAGTVLLTYCISRITYHVSCIPPSGYAIRDTRYAIRDTKEPTWLPLLPPILLAFIPQFIFINASCSNDPAITFTSTLTLFLLLWIARDGVTPRRAALLGSAIGLMALSKLTGTVLAIVAFGLLFAITRRFSAVAVAGAAFAATAGWWYIRNQLVYGDPLALNAFLRFVGGNLEVRQATLSFLWDQFRLLRFSTWGLFGHISVLMEPEWIYLIFDLAAAVGGIGLILAVSGLLIAALRQQGFLNGLKTFLSENRALLIVLLWCGAVLATGARWFFAAGIQGRLIFPGLPAAAVLLVYGATYVISRITYPVSRIPYYEIQDTGYMIRNTSYIIALPMIAFAAAVIPAYLIPAYSPPPLVESVPAAAVQTGVRFGDEIALRGYTIARERSEQSERDILRLTFYWEALRTPAADYTVAIRLVRPDGSFWLDYVNYPGMGTSLPTTWKPGELRQDEYVFDVNRFPPESAPLRLIVGYFDRRVRSMIPVSNWNDIREPGWASLAEVDLRLVEKK